MTSKCCSTPMQTHYGDEGTNCWICSKCEKACDPKEEENMTATDTNDWEDEFNLAIEDCRVVHVYDTPMYNAVKAFIERKRTDWIQELITELEAIAHWPDPQEGAGEGLGPLAGVGMYHQYNIDRKKHEEQVMKIIELLKSRVS